VPTRSALGAEGRADLANIQISGEDLAVAVPENMSPFDIVEIAKVEAPSRIGSDAMVEYCAEHAKLSPTFCARLAQGLL
jgi:hypothetical protein